MSRDRMLVTGDERHFDPATISSVRWENVRERTLQAAHDLLQTTKRDTLLAAFEPVQRRWWQSKLLRELGEGHIASLLAKEGAELSFKPL